MDGLSGRRGSQRKPVVLAASAWAISGSRSVLISDISSSGVRLRGRDLPAAAEEVLVTIGPLELFAKVSWCDHDECGLAFENALTPDIITQMQKQGDWALVTGDR
jgi:hypothetical protein